MSEARKQKVSHLFFNRDESWLKFNRRVLEESQDVSNPLLERVRFLSITASNLDEFTEVRIAGILQRIEEGVQETGKGDDGLNEQERLDQLADQVHRFVHDQYDTWRRDLLPALSAAGIRILSWDELSAAQREQAHTYFDREVDPLLTPVTIDPSHPFPRVLNKALCIALLLRRKRPGNRQTVLGVITVPRALSRLVRLQGDGTEDFLFLHELIEARVERMFPGYEVLSRSAFRVTRNSNLYVQEEESRSLLESVREELHNRRKGDVVRLEIQMGADEAMLEELRQNFELDRWQVFRTDGPVNLTRIADLYTQVDRPELKFGKFSGRPFTAPRNREGEPEDMFSILRERDLLFHHPYDSYSVVEQFLGSAAKDPRVVSMKQTLYRTSSNSPLFQSLLEAANNKDVTVVVELKARFDEDSNIRWASQLEEAGMQVFHGIVGLKTHAKLALVVRRDPDGVTRRYAHLGTGNYNSVTARFYTDISLLTADPAITAAVQKVFQYLTANCDVDDYKPLLVAPKTLAPGILELIRREAQHAKAGRPAHIIAKMNALLEEETIRALYAASKAGVEVDLVVRGMCALRPGVPGLSERIRVRSIVGRFLEHSRIFWFANGSKDGNNSEVYCGSADWMARNLFDRCETVFPVTNPDLRSRLRDEILQACLDDTAKARLLTATGDYVRAGARPNAPRVNSQELLMKISAEPQPSGTAAKAATAALCDPAEPEANSAPRSESDAHSGPPPAAHAAQNAAAYSASPSPVARKRSAAPPPKAAPVRRRSVPKKQNRTQDSTQNGTRPES